VTAFRERGSRKRKGRRQGKGTDKIERGKKKKKKREMGQARDGKERNGKRE
jgi:hypothetical protein